MTKRQEVLVQIKWIFISILACGFVGAIIAGVQVVFFEQTPSGRYAVHNECVLWDENCVQDCQDSQDPVRPTSCESCCLKRDDLIIPLGMRIKELAWQYGLIGGSIGITIGLIIAEEKRRKL